MNALMKIAGFLAKRPSDATIRVLKVFLGLSLLALFAGVPWDYILPFQASYESHALIVKYTLGALGLLPLLSGATGLCIFKRKTMKRMQLIVGIFLFILGIMISPSTPENIPTHGTIGNQASENASGASFSALTQTTPAKPVQIPVGGLLIILSFLPLFGGITGKCVTEKCLKYKETIKKIRV